MPLNEPVILNQVFVSIGNILKTKRESKGLHIEDIAHHIKIRACYLNAIEEGRFFDIVTPTYLKGYLRNYANFLGENTQDIIALFEKAEKLPEETHMPVKFHPILRNNVLHPSRGLLFFSICLLMLVYTGYRFYLPTPVVLSKEIYQNLNQEKIVDDAVLKDTYSETRAFLSYLKSQKSRLILLSKGENWVSIYDNKGHAMFEKKIAEGDIYFIPEDKDITINATHAELVEVFVEGESYVFLGTIQKLKEDIDHPLWPMFAQRKE